MMSGSLFYYPMPPKLFLIHDASEQPQPQDGEIRFSETRGNYSKFTRANNTMYFVYITILVSHVSTDTDRLGNESLNEMRILTLPIISNSRIPAFPIHVQVHLFSCWPG